LEPVGAPLNHLQWLEPEKSTASKSRRLNVVVVRSLPLYPRGGPKWQDNYPEGPNHPVVPNRLEMSALDPTICGTQNLSS